MTAPSSGSPVPPVPDDPPPPRRLLLGDLLLVAGGLVVFGFSFAPFIQYGEQTRQSLFGLDFSTSFNAWSMETFMVPLTTFVIVAALLGIAAVVIRFAVRRDPQLLGFRLRQLEVGFALFAFVVLLGMVASDKQLVLGARRLAEADPGFNLDQTRVDTGWGAVLMLVGALIALVGALLNHLGVGPTVPVGSRPATGSDLPAGGAAGEPPPPGPWQARQPPPPGSWQGAPPPPAGGEPPPPPRS